MEEDNVINNIGEIGDLLLDGEELTELVFELKHSSHFSEEVFMSDMFDDKGEEGGTDCTTDFLIEVHKKEKKKWFGTVRQKHTFENHKMGKLTLDFFMNEIMLKDEQHKLDLKDFGLYEQGYYEMMLNNENPRVILLTKKFYKIKEGENKDILDFFKKDGTHLVYSNIHKKKFGLYLDY